MWVALGEHFINDFVLITSSNCKCKTVESVFCCQFGKAKTIFSSGFPSLSVDFILNCSDVK